MTENIDPQTQLRRFMKKMKDISYTCTTEWLLACIQWVVETYAGEDGGRIREEALMEELKSQWLDSNLEQMESKCLPPGLADIKLITLPGSYGLQINSIQDIGESAYSQYTKLKKLENENVNVTAEDNATQFVASWQPKPRRSLYLTLTDGQQKIFGLEVESIPALSLKTFQPGAKVRIKGPVDCRKGVLHLKSQHVDVLGGQVEQLAENTVENILAKSLNKDRNTERNARSVHSQITQAIDSDIPTQAVPAAPGNTTNRSLQHSNISAAQSNNQIPVTQVVDISDSQPETDAFGDDDDLFMQIDESILLNNVQTVPQPSRTQILDPIIGKDNPQQPQALQRKELKPVQVSKSPWQYIKQIKDGLFKIGDIIQLRAVISTLLSNIKVDKSNGDWTLTVNINDGSGFLIVKIAPDLLNQIIGFTPSEMKEMKATKTPEAKASIASGLERLTSTLVHLNGILRVRLTESEPILIGHSEITEYHVAALSKRIETAISALKQ